MSHIFSKTTILIMSLLCLCSCSFIQEDNASMPNPWIEYNSLHDAKQNSLFLLSNAPHKLNKLSLNYIAILRDGSISEVMYGDSSIILRKGLKQDNIAGDYNKYPVTKSKTISGKSVQLSSKTKSGTYNLAEWNDTLRYSCSVYSEDGFTEDELQELISDVF